MLSGFKETPKNHEEFMFKFSNVIDYTMRR